MRLDLDKVRANARGSSTEDLLDRVTVYRGEMEPSALVVLEEELRQRGVTAAEQSDHGERRRQSALVGEGGAAVRCEMTDDTAWRLLFNALPAEALADVRCSGDTTLLTPLLRARSVVV